MEEKSGILSEEERKKAIQRESKRFEEFFLWIEKEMPQEFFHEINPGDLTLITHNLMDLDLHNFFSTIFFKDSAAVLCLDADDADLRILKHFSLHGIKHYCTFISFTPPPFPGLQKFLRIAILKFTSYIESSIDRKEISEKRQKEILKEVKKEDPRIDDKELKKLLEGMDKRFFHSMDEETFIKILHMFYRARKRDQCQYEVIPGQEWKEKGKPSLQLIFAWRNTPKYNFLFRLAKTIYRHGLQIKKANATYIDPYSAHSVLLMVLDLHGSKGKAVWEEADMADFLQEFVTLKYFEGLDTIESTLVDTGLIRGNLGNLVRTMISFVHQVLNPLDPHLYSLQNTEEGFLRHPELTVRLCDGFEKKFHPQNANLTDYAKARDDLLALVDKLDTGQEVNDTRRKNILRQAMNFIEFTLKNNFYANNKTSLSFRLDPGYLEFLPYDRKEKFPELPYAVFFIKGMHFIGFHVRFKDISRGGLRTVFPERMETMVIERNFVFSECYNLAYTQQKKNKDIPEGGSKAIIFLEPYERLLFELKIYMKELEQAGIGQAEIEAKVKEFRSEYKLEYLYQTQRAFISSLLTLINFNPDGTLKAKNVVDYLQKPEYIYLGPDENMHNEMIEWIANYSKECHYALGSAFITSKPKTGINHKEYGVTSLGVNVCMEEVLKYLGIDPRKESFTVKISGGPDGDVAGNQILNLFRFYPDTAKLLTLIDVSGVIYDPKGLDLETMVTLFKESKPLRFYPPEELSDGGFLLDVKTKREQTAYAFQTLLWRKKERKLLQDWISGNEMNHILRHTVHRTKTDVFIPAGGRPRTLNENNVKDFLDETGAPSSRAIIEGANLYLTPQARRFLEKMGVLIIKDSSANKGGVICSSFEVLVGLTLTEEEFLKEKPFLMPEILSIIQARAREEARLLLNTHHETGQFLTEISERVSERINSYTYQMLDYLRNITLPDNPLDPLNQCLLNYCPPYLHKHYQERILKKIPDIHKKAIISCYIASRLVYFRGLGWHPTIVDVLPLIVRDSLIIGNE